MLNLVSKVIASALLFSLLSPVPMSAAPEVNATAGEVMAGLRGQCDVALMTLEALEDPILFPANKVDRKVALAGFQSVAFIGLAQSVAAGSTVIGGAATGRIQARLKKLFEAVGSEGFDGLPVAQQIRVVSEGFAAVRELTLPTGSQPHSSMR